MKKTILITLCCASLMLITPLTGVAQENTVSNNLPEQPDDVEGLVAQIRIVVDEILQKYGHIPIVRGLCNMILGLLSDLIGKIIYCITLIILAIPVGILGLFLGLVLRLEYIAYHFLGMALVLISKYDRNCPPSTPLNNLLSSFHPLYTLSETNDITNHAK